MSFKRIFIFLSIVCVLISSREAVFAQDSADLIGGGQIDFSFAPVQTFPPGGDSPVLLFQPDGKILASGRFEAGLGAANRLSRFFPNGQKDASFNTTVPFRIDAFALQPDGKILCSYRFLGPQQYQLSSIIRLNSDGSQDASFNYNLIAEGVINSIVVLPDNRILIGGFIREKVEENPAVKFVGRLEANGTFDRTFGGNGNGSAAKTIRQPDGKILVHIMFDNILLRLNSDGTPDTGFVQNSGVGNFFLLPGGKIIVVQSPQNSQNEIIRINANGTLDPTFQSQHTLRPFNSLAVQSDGKILLNGFRQAGSTFILHFERLGENGSLLQSFTSYFGRGRIFLSPNDSIFLGGEMTIENKTRGIVKIHGNLTATRRKAFDFDGDGKADLAVFRPSDGVWYILNSQTNTFKFIRFGLAGDKPVPADYDGDTKADIAVFRPSNGVWYRLNSSNGQFEATQFGLADDIPTQNDFDGDGRDDISVFRPSNGVWYRFSSSNGSFAAFQYGTSGDKPLAGDYDGDGKADFAVWRPADGVWYRFSSIENASKSDFIGYYEGDVGTPADFDGDGRLDLVFFKDLTGDWYGLRSASNTGFYVEWGITGDKPVPADYDGDGKDDISVWRPSTGTWWIINSANGSFSAYQFGTNGDIPVQLSFVR